MWTRKNFLFISTKKKIYLLRLETIPIDGFFSILETFFFSRFHRMETTITCEEISFGSEMAEDALIRAICHGEDVPKLRELVDSGCNIDWCMESGKNALWWAVQTDQYETTAFLLRRGIAWPEQEKSCCDPLSLAILHDRIDLVKLLLAYAQLRQWNALAMLEVMFVYDTPILIELAKKNRAAMLGYLIDSGANYKILDQEGGNVYHTAAKHNHVGIVLLLAQTNLEIAFHPNRHGLTPLAIACLHDNVDVAIVLIRFGADLESRVSDCDSIHQGKTCLDLCPGITKTILKNYTRSDM
jgi:ankyrin repeat protein